MNDVFAHLNGSDALLQLEDDADSASANTAARRRVLARLGDYVAAIMAPLNLRPTGGALLSEDDQRVEVRVSTPSSHVVLAIALTGDMAAEVFFLRTLAGTNLPVPRLVAHDLSCTLVPCTYALESYVAGIRLDRLEDGPLMRVAARQVGRTLRRIHQHAAPGAGRPTTTGRWPSQAWAEALSGWLAQYDLAAQFDAVFGSEGAAALRAATIEHPALACQQPSLIHGAVEPRRAIVTVGDSVHLEALTRPGLLVGGDPLFDLALGLLPRHPQWFRQGLLEGYCATGALGTEQELRLRRLCLLLRAADCLRNGDAEAIERLPAEVAAEIATLEGPLVVM